jgi:hypothetical protein
MNIAYAPGRRREGYLKFSVFLTEDIAYIRIQND